jgi:hypothetical protein
MSDLDMDMDMDMDLDPDLDLADAAERGDAEGCVSARAKGATAFNSMLAEAAGGGHHNLCVLAKEWGASDFNWMLAEAAWGGHRDLCILAKEWGATDFNRMLSCASTKDLRDLAWWWLAVRKEPLVNPAAHLLLALLVGDELLGFRQNMTPSAARYFRIMTRLPLELQACVSLCAAGLAPDEMEVAKISGQTLLDMACLGLFG